MGDQVTSPLLSVRDLSVDYRSRDLPPSHAVRNVSFDIEAGEFVGLLGESGCGKSTLGNAVLRLLDVPAYHAGGAVLYEGRDLYAMSDRELTRLRWREISTVFQSSMNSLNPVMRIVAQFEDVMRAHDWDESTEGAVRDRIREVLSSVDLDAERVMRSYPHELSGGMRQRVVLALALVLRPRLVILDEPTTGLDVVVQRQIVTLLRGLQEELGFSVLFISHDLGTVLEISDRVMVMYAGELVEVRPGLEIADDPLHPYSAGLLGSFDDPRAEKVSVAYIPGRPPALAVPPVGCPFAPRCPVVIDKCSSALPPVFPLDTKPGEPAEGVPRAMVRCHRFSAAAPRNGERATFASVPAWSDLRAADEPVGADAKLEPVAVVEGLCKTFHRRQGLRRTTVEAVVDVSFSLVPGRVRALVGQSGSGKSTIAKILTGMEHPTSGKVTVAGREVSGLRGKELHEHRADIQMVFQDPFAALNPTKTVGYMLERPLRNYQGLRGEAARERGAELLESVGLSPGRDWLDKLPHQLSGGQRQRVVIARAMAPEPKILVADEPISMLDVSIRAEILELLAHMVAERGVAMLYITHDLLSARLLADETMVMRAGRIVEDASTLDVVRRPDHDYTRLLLDSIPNPHALSAAQGEP